MPEAISAGVIHRSPGLDRGFVLSGPPEGRLYLRPTGLLAGPDARAACAAGRALPLAGGPLAFPFCEVLLRGGRSPALARIDATLVSLAELEAWAARQDPHTAAHVAGLLEALSAPRPPFAGLTLDRPRLMAIVNVTPDSFSDGGAHLDSGAAAAQARALVEAGADIIDVGGESTRPGAVPVDPRDELARVAPVLAGLAGAGTLSVDTRHATVMAAALDVGAAIVNDVTALAGDPASLELVAARGASVVLMHMQGEPATMNRSPHYGCAPLDVYDALAARVAACLAAGIPRARIAVDPGLGFGKKTRHNLELLERLSLFHGLGCAMLLGASRKLLVGAARAAVPPKARIGASLAAALAALDQGVQILRVHDVAETGQAVALWRALRDPA